jgi:hypothetical protein
MLHHISFAVRDPHHVAEVAAELLLLSDRLP